jgi:predicted lipid-binding transport protein (Tim44 family)
MMKLLSTLAVVLTLGLSAVSTDAEAAKRLGGGKSSGTQRQATADKAPATPAQSAAAPTAGAAGAAAAAPKRSWMGPIAGLAAGLGLAALASHLGFGDELASMLMMGLLAFAVIAAIGYFMRKRAVAQAQGSGMGAAPGGMQYAHVNPAQRQDDRVNRDAAPAYKVSMPASANGSSAIGSAIGSGIGSGVGSVSRIPADFDTAGFERNAKVNFIRLQAANDAGNLDDIRQFTTPEMFAELKMDLQDRGGAEQKTDVVSINAQVTEVDEDADRYLVSVRFTGVVRDDSAQQDESFDEVWHMMKPRQGNHGWVLSGIQQTQ